MSNLFIIIVSAAIGGLITLITTYASSIFLERKEKRKWETETGLKYIELSLSHPELARKLSKQFAVALLVWVDDKGNTMDKYFLPAFCRYTVGRLEDNDICIADEYLSRDHGLFIYDKGKIYYQDSATTNKTQINGSNVNHKVQLNDGDELIVGFSKLMYRKL